MSPYILPWASWTLSRPPQPLSSGLYLVTRRAAWPQQLSMMTAAVETPIVVEVDEVYQGLATGLAGKASPVPAALLSCSGCKNSIFPWPQLFPALQGWGGGEVCCLIRGGITLLAFLLISQPQRDCSPHFPRQAHSPLLQAPQRTPKLSFPIS